MTRRRNTWVKRTAGVLGTWFVLTLLFQWLYMRPSWPGMLALTTAAFGLIWLLQDFHEDVDPVAWKPHEEVASRRSSVDGRLGYLRRMVTQSYESAEAGSVKGRGAGELQQILQAVTADRLRAQHAAGQDENATDVIRRLAPQVDRQLVTYLLSAPPPQLDEPNLTNLLTRIEDL